MKSNSDTETLINFIENFDIDYVLKNISGMFAFVVYDFKDDKLYLARDIAGEKPLYITANEEYLAFSSDLKPFKNLNFYKKDINKIALKSYLKYNYVPAPITIFENTFKIKSASLIDINLKKYNFKTIKSYQSILDDKIY